MRFTDPDNLTDRLLWLRADRDVAGGFAAHFDGVTHTRLQSGGSGGDLQAGDNDFLFACWVRINTLPAINSVTDGNTHIAGKFNITTGVGQEWLLCLNGLSAADQFCFTIKSASVADAPRTAFPGGVEVGRWYFVVGWHDATNPGGKQLGLSVDGAAPIVVPYEGGTPSLSSTFMMLGAQRDATGTPAISIAHACWFKNPIGGIAAHVDDLIAALSAPGVTPYDLTSEQRRQWGGVAYWPLDERTGTRLSHWSRTEFHNLNDADGVGATPGPFTARIAHLAGVYTWTDPTSNVTFTGTAGQEWRGDGGRIAAFESGARLTHDGLLLSGRSTWTATLAAGTRMGSAFALYGESNVAEDEYLDIRVDDEGVPELAIKPASGAEVVVKATEGLAGRRSATAVSAEAVVSNFDAIPRVRCVLDVGTGHLFAASDYVQVSGLGAPFDGEHLLIRATDDEITYIAENQSVVPDPLPVAPGVVFGSGEGQLSDILFTEAGDDREHRRYVLTVRRDGETISFFRNGDAIGTGAIGPTVLGPATGSSTVFGNGTRLGAPVGSVRDVHLAGSALTDETIAGLAGRFSVKASRTKGVGPLAILFDATQMARVDRLLAQDHHYLWTFTQAGSAQLHDADTSVVSGHAYARSTGFLVSQVFEAEGDYDVHLAVLTGRYDRQGQVQVQQCLFAGKLMTVTVDPWPEDTTTLYVSETHPDRDDAGPGTSATAPLATIHEALERANAPYTKILMARGETVTFPDQLELVQIPGPFLLGGHGDPLAVRPTLASEVAGVYTDNSLIRPSRCEDLRLSGLIVRGPESELGGQRANGIISGGSNVHLLYHDIELQHTQLANQFAGSDRMTIYDRCYFGNVRGDYVFYTTSGMDLSVTRCDMEPANQHNMRLNTSHRSQLAYCTSSSEVFSVRSWFTPRHQTQWFSVSDSFGGIVNITLQNNFEHFTGPRWGMIERSDIDSINNDQGSEMTFRGMHLRRNLDVKVGVNIRGGTVETVRVYGLQLGPDGRLRENVQLLQVNDANFTYDPPAPLVAPPIVLSESVPGAAVLAAASYGEGGPARWSMRWMRRLQGVGDFTPLEGQKGIGLYDLPPTSGTYEYRLDLVSESEDEAIGGDVVVLTIADDDTETGYRVDPSSPAECNAGTLSEPFFVTLRGDVLQQGLVTITPISDHPGQFEPSQVVLSAEGPSAEFRYTATDSFSGNKETHWISTTNDAGLLAPPPVSLIVQNSPSRIIEGPSEPSEPQEPVEGPSEPSEPQEPVEGPSEPSEPQEPRRRPIDPRSDVLPPFSDIRHRLSGPPLKADSEGEVGPPPEANGPSRFQPNRNGSDRPGRPSAPWERKSRR